MHPGPESHFYVAADGLRLHYLDFASTTAPEALPVVCLAGLTRSAVDFGPLGHALASSAAKPRRVIAFDYRGRGRSEHDSDWRHYSLTTEGADVLRGLAICGIDRAHFVGTSRGGLQVMALAADHRAMIGSVVFNDIGPVLEADGLRRIKGYVGVMAKPKTMREAITLLQTGAGRDFDGLSKEEWRLFAATTFGEDEDDLCRRYDPALARMLDALDLAKPLPESWDQFDALHGLPVLTIRGANSDLLSEETLARMGARWPGCETLTVAGQGHAPLLADHLTIRRIEAFLAALD